MVKGLNRKAVFGNSQTARTTFTLRGEDASYRVRVGGIPADYTLAALAKHLKGKDAAVTVRGEENGVPPTFADVRPGDVFCPFVSSLATSAPDSDKPRGRNRLGD